MTNSKPNAAASDSTKLRSIRLANARRFLRKEIAQLRKLATRPNRAEAWREFCTHHVRYVQEGMACSLETAERWCRLELLEVEGDDPEEELAIFEQTTTADFYVDMVEFWELRGELV